jgi:hypothetical protein
MTYDSIDAHLPLAGAMHRAVMPMAWYLAWCAQHDLLSQTAIESAGDSLLRLRYREITPVEFFVPLAAGELEAHLLNAAGRKFTERYYAEFMASLRDEFGDRLYRMADNWDTYSLVASYLSQRMFKPEASADRPWWKIWK